MYMTVEYRLKDQLFHRRISFTAYFSQMVEPHQKIYEKQDEPEDNQHSTSSEHHSPLPPTTCPCLVILRY